MTAKWQDYPNDHLMSLDECADISGYSKGTLYKHRYAGLLPFVPGRPIQIHAGDFRIYMKLVAEDVRDKLHRSLKIEMEDRASYSTLSTVPDFQAKSPTQIIKEVIAETQVIWERYKATEETDHRKLEKRKKQGGVKHRHRAAAE